jgi:hypothetical protein
MKKFACLLTASLLLTACGTSPTALRPATLSRHSAVAAKSHVYTLDEMGVAKKQLRALEQAGITNSTDLLEAGRTDYGREKLVTTTGIEADALLELVNMVDMLRVNGIGPGQSRLLYGAGVHTVKDLAQRNPAALQAALATLNDEERVLERTPGLDTVAKWVEQAKALDRVVTY